MTLSNEIPWVLSSVSSSEKSGKVSLVESRSSCIDSFFVSSEVVSPLLTVSLLLVASKSRKNHLYWIRVPAVDQIIELFTRLIGIILLHRSFLELRLEGCDFSSKDRFSFWFHFLKIMVFVRDFGNFCERKLFGLLILGNSLYSRHIIKYPIN